MLLSYHRKKEAKGLIYSIDFFSFEFSLNLTPSLWEEFEEAIKALGSRSKKMRSYQGTKKKGKFHKYRAYEIDKLHVQFYDDAPVIQLDFNPNTVFSVSDESMRDVLSFCLSYIRSSNAVSAVKVKRADYALDVPKKYSELYVYTRKCESHVRSTRYYGDAKSSGRLRVYDKSAEQKEVYGSSLGFDLTRCEWIQRNEKPFNYDSIGEFDFSDLSGAVSVISLVPVEFFNEALQRLSVNTRKKLVSTMQKLEIDASAFDELMHEYYDEFGIFELRMLALKNRALDFDFDDDDYDDQITAGE